MIYSFLLVILIFAGIYYYQLFAGGVDNITKNIERRWLRITLQIILKTIVFCCVACGVISIAIVMLAFSYKPNNKK